MKYVWLTPELEILIKLLHCNVPWILLDNETSLHTKQCITIFITITATNNHPKNNDLLCIRLLIYITSSNPQDILQSTYLLASFLKMKKLGLREGKPLALHLCYSTGLWCFHRLAYLKGQTISQGRCFVLFYLSWRKVVATFILVPMSFESHCDSRSKDLDGLLTTYNIHMVLPLGLGSCNSLTLECPSLYMYPRSLWS